MASNTESINGSQQLKDSRNRDAVAVFRLQLFKPSETFITEQASNLQRYDPIYVGRKLFGSPIDRAVAVPNARTWLGRTMQGAAIQALRFSSPFMDEMTQLRQHPKIIHAHFAVDSVYAMPLADSLGCPLITTLHGFDVTRSEMDMLKSCRPALVNAVLFRKHLTRRGDMFLCVSNFIREAALSRGYPENKTLVHHIGIDTEARTARTHSGESGLIVHVARLVEKKGTSLLLEAVAKLAVTNSDVKLIVIGDGPLRASLEAKAQRLGISSRVSFLGMLPPDDVKSWDTRAALKAVPSITARDGDREGLPTVITETNALGVPVVAFSSGGIAEAIIHGENGFLSPEHDVDGLVHHMKILLDNSELRGRMGRTARSRVESEFDIRKQTVRLEEIYDEARGIGHHGR
ncbi:glycosyltransferase [Stenotrophomonas sp.]|uniref:glycosyltransferase n=1 Tax=Stenotrophomonas sp. TaxID=69392 RepID=UPI0028AF0EFD|nr:glycosyltransferase [Stenotrophomonas sp.]